MLIQRKVPKYIIKAIQKYQDDNLLTVRELIKVIPITNNTYYNIMNDGKATIFVIRKIIKFLENKGYKVK